MIAVAVGGTGVAVGGTGVGVGGTGVAVGGRGVFVGGMGVAVGGTGVEVAGTGSAVGVACAGVGAGLHDAVATRAIASAINKRPSLSRSQSLTADCVQRGKSSSTLAFRRPTAGSGDPAGANCDVLSLFPLIVTPPFLVAGKAAAEQNRIY